MKYGTWTKRLILFPALLIFAAEVCLAGSGTADSVSVFAATDRHSHYETV